MPSQWTRSYVSSAETEEVLDHLMRSGRGRSDAIRTMALRYAEVIRRSRPQLSSEEWDAVREALHGGRYDDPLHLRGIPLAVEDAFEDGVAERHGVDGPRLLEKLRSCTFAELVAIAAEVE